MDEVEERVAQQLEEALRRHVRPKAKQPRCKWHTIGVVNAIVINIATAADADKGAGLIGAIMDKLAAVGS